jgi:hypothetical protein
MRNAVALMPGAGNAGIDKEAMVSHGLITDLLRDRDLMWG